MNKAILAKKVGMTQVFDEDGQAIPVTVLRAGPCTVVDIKTPERDGYSAVQVGFEPAKKNRLNKPQLGRFEKAGIEPKKFVREFRLSDIDGFEVGQEIKVDIFAPGEYVDVSGITKGKGFAGSIKRHGQGMGPLTHGSRYHRGPGALGTMNEARVFKGQTLPGRMGGNKVSVQKLEVVKVDENKNVMLVRGAVPGPRGGLLTIKDSVKVS